MTAWVQIRTGKKAGMKTRKWLSNSPKVLTVIPMELRAFEIHRKPQRLGINQDPWVLWNVQEDVFSFVIAAPVGEDIPTKRLIVKKVAEVFNPFGLASPFILGAKILILDFRTMGLGCDEPITDEISFRAKLWSLEFDD